jgi:glycosyltransferase involved in cell wall biosynthesis
MKPKVAILGTRGIIINNSSVAGGFETFAKKISLKLLERECADVTVYLPHYINFDKQDYNGVKLKRIYNPERVIGKAGNIIYDYLSFRDALKSDFDIIIECGYGSFVPAVFLNKKGYKPVLAVNMDGFEWKRSSFIPASLFFKWTEKIVANRADILIADHPVIYNYLKTNYMTKVALLSYGTDIPAKFDERYLKEYSLTPKRYFIVVSRPIQENNIDLIFKAFYEFLETYTLDYKLVWVTNKNSKFARKIIKNYNSKNYVYIDSINEDELFALRHFATAYIHGHSSGGTNPSLLEAIASKVPIIAHKNEFTTLILQNNASYFTDVIQLKELLFTVVNNNNDYISNINNSQIANISWDVIVDKYCEFLSLNTL